MAYTVLARRYRSSTFDELVGQQHVAQTLKRAIASGRIAHAFLFCGTRGTGKTSVARILAKALNCLSSDRPTPEPCNSCASCQGIARGDDMDYVEIDAASHTGVDNVREVIISNTAYRPALCRFKIFLIDEVHMLSKSSFNALLKTLEEPPEHVKFILATTEPEKIPATILSRCQRYDFRNIHPREVVAHLERICQKEGIVADEAALLRVARAGGGSMRDSLSLLDRLLSVGEKKLTVEAIEQLLGVPPSQQLESLVEAMGQGQVSDVLARADAVLAGGLSPDTLVASLIDFLHQLLLLNVCGGDSDLLELTDDERSRLAALARRFDAVTLTQDIAVLEELRRQVRSGTAGRPLLDATLVRLALAEQFRSISELLTAPSGATAPPTPSGPPAPPSERAASADEKKKPVEPPAPLTPPPPPERFPPPGRSQANPTAHPPAAVAPDVAPAAAPAPSTTATAPSSSAAIADDDDDDELPRPGKVWSGGAGGAGGAGGTAGGPSLVELLRQAATASTTTAKADPPAASERAAPPTPAGSLEPVDERQLPELWQRILEGFRASQPGLIGVLDGSEIGTIEDGCVTIRLAPGRQPLMSMMDREGRRQKVVSALSEALGQPVGVRWTVADAPTSPAATGGSSPAPRGSSPAPRGSSPAPGGVAPSGEPATAARGLQKSPPGQPWAGERGGERAGEIESPPTAAPEGDVLPLTDAVKSELLEQPLVRALVDELGATLVKVTRA
ncbi:MAG: DNA polymerase III subunit gamma/tau [Tepidisphaerales bacterium]